MTKGFFDYKLWLRQAVKLALAFGLIFWLVSPGRLEVSPLKSAYGNLGILSGAILIWLVGVGVFATWRWLLLMKGIGLTCRFWRCCQLTLTGGFFNTVLIGTVGGDILRGVYAFKDNRSRGRAAPAMTVLIDRITGLYGLFFIGVCGIAANLSAIGSQPQLLPPAIFVVGIFCVLTLGFVSIQVPATTGIGRFFSWVASSRYVPRGLKSIYLSFRSYREGKSFLFYAILISIVIQGQLVLFYWFVTEQVTGQAVPLNLLALVVPIGSLITAIPISPGGLGVGHAAFERLYALIGIADGANIFNIVILGQMAMNLLGSIPYLFLRSHERETMALI
jgi:uncharacterized protein (TIRG00374 family)